MKNVGEFASDASVPLDGFAEAPYCALRLSGVQDFAASSEASVSWGIEDADNAGMWSPGNPSRIVAPVTGLYKVCFDATWSYPDAGGSISLSPDDGQRYHYLRLNGSTLIEAAEEGPHRTSRDNTTNNFTLVAAIALTATNYFEVRCTSVAAATRGLRDETGGYPPTRLVVAWIGRTA